MATGVCIAFTDHALTAAPTWTSIDSYVRSWTVDRGRSFELDKTQTGTASVTIVDTTGRFDPTNAGGAYYGNLDPNKQFAVFQVDPVSGSTATLFRGFVEDLECDVDVSEKYMTVNISAVDGFDKLAASEVTPLTAADVASAGFDKTVIGSAFYAGQQVDDRIKAALTDAGWPTGLENIFSGNVSVQGTVYPAGASLLQVIQDAADAEFPGVANVFINKLGKVAFRGRLARFNPATYEAASDAARTDSTQIVAWKAGDTAAYNASPTDTALVSGFKFDRSKSKLVNAALASPVGILDKDVAGQLVTDTGSITSYGICGRSFENLITNQGDETGTPAANAETKKFATYYVDNYASPRSRISQVSFTVKPATSAYAAHWRLMVGVEIGDVVTVKTSHPGGGGFNEDFFVEGIHYEAHPMSSTHPELTLTLDLSPKAYFTTSPF